MTHPRKQIGLLRALGRARRLGDTGAVGLFREWRLRNQLGRPLSIPESAAWLHETCRTGLPKAGVRLDVSGTPPKRGLLLSNHMSYLDVITIAAASPAIFIAKKEVRDWLFLGRFARKANTLFLDRSRKSEVLRIQNEIRRLLREEVPLCLFPEGQTGDGRNLLPFRSPLLEPVAGTDIPVTCLGIGYTFTDGGDAGPDLAWSAGQSFFPNAWHLLKQAGVTAHLAFSGPMHCPPDRRQAAREFQETIEQLRHANIDNPRPPDDNEP